MSFHAVRVMCSMGLLWLLFGNQPKHSLNPMIYVWMAHHTNKRFVTKFLCCVLTAIFQTIIKPAKKETSNPKTIDMTELSIYSFIISSVWLLYLFSCFEMEEEFPSLNDGQLCPLVTTTSKSQETSTVRWQSWKNVLFLETPGRNWIMSHDVQPSHHHLSHLSSSI